MDPVGWKVDEGIFWLAFFIKVSGGQKIFITWLMTGSPLAKWMGLMEYLWSPWRMKYILNKDVQPDCVFCLAALQVDGPQNLIVARGEKAFVILNRYPYTSGHLMVVPYEHSSSFELVDPATRAEMMELLTKTMEVIRRVYTPQGFNIGANIGAAAGAGIADHVHFHVVPRWNGDTNFMSAVGGTRVLPESLEDTYHRLIAAWKDIESENK